MKREMFRCACCGRYLPRDPRVRNQRYCGQKKCQQARKNLWQRRKLETDPDYRAGKQESQQVWQSKNKGYWKKYRCDNFATSVLRNRQLQKVRDQRRLKPANQDNRVPTVDLAKKDALMVKIVPITPR